MLILDVFIPLLYECEIAIVPNSREKDITVLAKSMRWARHPQCTPAKLSLATSFCHFSSLAKHLPPL
jgi:hypothetical protein